MRVQGHWEQDIYSYYPHGFSQDVYHILIGQDSWRGEEEVGSGDVKQRDGPDQRIWSEDGHDLVSLGGNCQYVGHSHLELLHTSNLLALFFDILAIGHSWISARFSDMHHAPTHLTRLTINEIQRKTTDTVLLGTYMYMSPFGLSRTINTNEQHQHQRPVTMTGPEKRPPLPRPSPQLLRVVEGSRSNTKTLLQLILILTLVISGIYSTLIHSVYMYMS